MVSMFHKLTLDLDIESNKKGNRTDEFGYYHCAIRFLMY